jgi:hypothetical protein
MFVTYPSQHERMFPVKWQVERMFDSGRSSGYRGRMVTETELTGKRRDILDFIAAQLHERGYPPSVREIGEAVGLTSSSTPISPRCKSRDTSAATRRSPAPSR